MGIVYVITASSSTISMPVAKLRMGAFRSGKVPSWRNSRNSATSPLISLLVGSSAHRCWAAAGQGTGGEPVKPVDARPTRMFDTGHPRSRRHTTATRREHRYQPSPLPNGRCSSEFQGRRGCGHTGQKECDDPQIEWRMDPTKKRISPLLRTIIPATLIILVLLATLLACSDPTSTPTAATTPTEMPAPTETPTERPAAARAVTPARTPTHEPTTTPAPDGRLAPLKLPEDELWCQYAQDWAEIKSRWDLTMTEPEAEAVTEMLHTCENPPMVEVEVWVALETATGNISRRRRRSFKVQCTVPARKRRPRGSRGCREAREEGRVSPKRWSRARETETGMAWSVKSRFSP